MSSRLMPRISHSVSQLGIFCQAANTSGSDDNLIIGRKQGLICTMDKHINKIFVAVIAFALIAKAYVILAS